jgi:hypothetical protein
VIRSNATVSTQHRRHPPTLANIAGRASILVERHWATRCRLPGSVPLRPVLWIWAVGIATDGGPVQ